MAASKRVLRSVTAATATTSAIVAPSTPIPSPLAFTTSSSSHPPQDITFLPHGSKLPGLSPIDQTLLRRKQRRLRADAPSTLSSLQTSNPNPIFQNALNATLVFAQHEAGTAVCVESSGWILTCSHCFGDSDAEWRANRLKWLLSYDGVAVQVECRVWDARHDLALAKVVAVECPSDVDAAVVRAHFASVPVAAFVPSTGLEVICIGQPGRDDLESATKRRTRYNLVEVSEGQLRGMVPGADPLDNSTIGTLMHDAWTYWGHSGAPLMRRDDGELVGLHSSWDDETAMRHGIPLEAVREFLGRHLPSALAREA